MTITATISASPPAPSSAAPANFETIADAYVAWEETLDDQMNTAISQINAELTQLNAVMALAISWLADLSATADADPGAGKLRFNNATQNLATVLYVDDVDSTAVAGNVRALVTSFGSSTSTIKGMLAIVHRDFPTTKSLRFRVDSVTTVAGYQKINGAVVGYSAASPFAANDPLVVVFQRTVDVLSAGALGGRAYTVPADVAFSATPAFDASLSNVFHLGVLTGNVTGPTISNPAHGQTISIRVTQDATGSRTFAAPTGAKITGAPEAAVSRTSVLTLTYVGTANGVAINRWEGGWSTVAP